MSNTKMNDVFDLPLKSEACDDQCVSDLTDSRGIWVFSGDIHYTQAAAIAINAYDDNQARIAELENAIKSMNNFGKIDMEKVRECYGLVVND